MYHRRFVVCDEDEDREEIKIRKNTDSHCRPVNAPVYQDGSGCFMYGHATGLIYQPSCIVKTE